MLVISRKTGESFTVSDNIKITVVSISGDKVVLGIDAPKEIKIMREELLETIKANKASAQVQGTDDLSKIVSYIKSSKND